MFPAFCGQISINYVFDHRNEQVLALQTRPSHLQCLRFCHCIFYTIFMCVIFTFFACLNLYLLCHIVICSSTMTAMRLKQSFCKEGYVLGFVCFFKNWKAKVQCEQWLRFNGQWRKEIDISGKQIVSRNSNEGVQEVAMGSWTSRKANAETVKTFFSLRS